MFVYVFHGGLLSIYTLYYIVNENNYLNKSRVEDIKIHSTFPHENFIFIFSNPNRSEAKCDNDAAIF